MKALLFDMDGVLVDVRKSYEEAIRRTVRHFSGRALRDEETARFRNRGGLNNDWDLTAAILEDRGTSVVRPELVAYFQKLLWGEEGSGLIRNERWLLRPEVLGDCFRRHRLGIVTGRPTVEASWTLSRFEVSPFFSAVIAADDLPAGRHKPDPFGLRLALERLEACCGWYVGDTPDDMKAALAAGLVPLGIVPGHAAPETRAALLEGGARRIIEDINRIGEVLE